VLDLEGGQQTDVDVIVEVRQASGGAVFRTRYSVVSGGNGQLTFEIPRLTLLGGDYDVAIAFHEHGGDGPVIDRLLTFTVADVAGAEGIADLRGTWSFAGAPVEVGP
jgi:hypothetical protein